MAIRRLDGRGLHGGNPSLRIDWSYLRQPVHGWSDNPLAYARNELASLLDEVPPYAARTRASSSA